MIPDYQEVQPGDVVDFRYHAFRPVARGGMGMVFAARHNVLDEVLAIKCMPKAALKNDAERARLMRESVALARCRHPHIVSVRDAGVCAKHGPYVALELLTGRSLAGLLASRGRMTLPDGIEFVRQCAGALDHAHARLVIHRDLKPANIFIAASPSGRDVIKIIDFGVAYDREASTKLTEEGRTVGILDYMAPEQLMGRETHAPADVWGLAVTFFEAITGRTRLMRRSALVKVPSFSRKLVPGKNTWANCAVSLRNRSCTITKSIADSAALTCLVFGSLWAMSSPCTYNALN